jgi:hypothetical protein
MRKEGKKKKKKKEKEKRVPLCGFMAVVRRIRDAWHLTPQWREREREGGEEGGREGGRSTLKEVNRRSASPFHYARRPSSWIFIRYLFIPVFLPHHLSITPTLISDRRLVVRLDSSFRSTLYLRLVIIILETIYERIMCAISLNFIFLFFFLFFSKPAFRTYVLLCSMT